MKEEILKLDYDGLTWREITNYYKTRCLWLRRFFKLNLLRINVYKTKKGYHIYIWVNNRLSKQDILFYQLAFGSDVMREAFYWRRIKFPHLPKREWNILFFEKFYSKKSRKKPSKEQFDLKKSKQIINILLGLK